MTVWVYTYIKLRNNKTNGGNIMWRVLNEAIDESFIPEDYIDMDKKEVTEDDKNDTEG